MTVVAEREYTPQEYLTLERKAVAKSEYVNGKIRAMASANRNHNLITGNLFGELRDQLRNRPCEAYVNNMRVRVNATGLYAYPDGIVVCGHPRFEDEERDTLLNPTLVAEVFSPMTEAYDRGEKFVHYRYLESLQEYVLIAQDRMWIEHFARMGKQWLLTVFNRPDEVLSLPSIECAVLLSEIYARIDLPAGENLIAE